MRSSSSLRFGLALLLISNGTPAFFCEPAFAAPASSMKRAQLKNKKVKKLKKKQKKAPVAVVHTNTPDSSGAPGPQPSETGLLGPSDSCPPVDPSLAAAIDAIPVRTAAELDGALRSSRLVSVKLCNNISLAGSATYDFYPESAYEPDLGFAGTINGQGYRIEDYGVDFQPGPFRNKIGLITALNGATIENIEFTNIAVENDGDLTDTGRGIVAGNARNATFRNLKFQGHARMDDDRGTGFVVGRAEGSTFTNISVNGTLFGDYSVGGVAGEIFSSSMDGIRVQLTIPQPLRSNGFPDGVPYQAGGVVGAMSESSIRNANVKAEILSGDASGGIAGALRRSSQISQARVHDSLIVGTTDTVIGLGRQSDLIPISSGGIVGRTEDNDSGGPGQEIVGASFSGIVRGKYAGGILGEVRGGSQNLLRLDQIDVQGTVSALWNAGGAIGLAYGTQIENGRVQAAVESIPYPSQTRRRVGGFVGNRGARVITSLFEGTVSPDDTQINQVFTGPILAYDQVTEDVTGLVVDSYFNSDLSPRSNGYGQPRTSAQLRGGLENFAASWNFLQIWRTNLEQLPSLRSVERTVADFTLDGYVGVEDIFEFLNAYYSLAPSADMNGDGMVSLQDLFDFLGFYFASNA